MKPIKLLSLFAGIGAPEKALKNIGIPLELAGFSEIDKYAVKSYCAIHNVDEALNLGDITKIDEDELPKDIDLITYGFPCQDISVSGKQKGLFNEDGTQTRSGLFFEALRIIEATQPKVAIAENVKNLVGKKFKLQFDIVLKCLETAGYNNYWKVLNAKDFGIPQNRERVFIVSVRKDVDGGEVRFPEGFALNKRLKDVLENEVATHFYITPKNLTFTANPTKCLETDKIMQTIQIHSKGNPQSGRVYSPGGLSPTLDTCSGGVRMPKITEEITFENEKFIAASRGRNPNNPSDRSYGAPTVQRLEPNRQGISNTLTTVQKDNYVVEPGARGFKIRKLTPKECWRLMGFEDSDFEKAEAVNSNTQLYKQAGNSIVVPVLEHIFKQLFMQEKTMFLWTDNPEKDAARYYEENRPEKIGVCEQCSDPIYEGDDHYDIEGDMVHWDCLTDYMDKYRVKGY